MSGSKTAKIAISTLVLGLAWGRFAVAGAVSGVALAVLLHVTVALGLITLAYLAAEWLTRRQPVAALTAGVLVIGASLLVLILCLGPFR